jgi:hypothetical protein
LAGCRRLELGSASEKLLHLALIQEPELASALLVLSALPRVSASPRVSAWASVRATAMAALV